MHRSEEFELLRAILEKHFAANSSLSAIERVRARDLSDGGMGSIELDQYEHLFELDMWKVDFSPLIQYPNFRTIRNLRCFPVEGSK